LELGVCSGVRRGEKTKTRNTVCTLLLCRLYINKVKYIPAKNKRSKNKGVIFLKKEEECVWLLCGLQNYFLHFNIY